EFHPDTAFSQALSGANKGAMNIPVLEQPKIEGDAALGGISQRRRHAGIRHGNHHIGRHRVFPSQRHTQLATDLVDPLAQQEAVRPGELHKLKDVAAVSPPPRP
ncbi:MAG TPA: hypothetical protein VNZ22_15245, partial [Bacillota bacterium]|nr:hypothetical protein [Bacillota bacterium]